MLMDRVQGLSPPDFLERHILPSQPVIVVDAMTDWDARLKWTPTYLAQSLGECEVQVYDDLFSLTDITTLAAYLDTNFNRREGDPASEYVRWYSQLKEVDFVWADAAFARLKDDWRTPYFLPEEGYAIPGAGGRVTAEASLFPYRGLFISGRGARTRLHRDPWTTNAVLCQFYGEKELVMYSPDQAVHLMNGSQFVDITRPDLAAFPGFERASPSYRDVLRPGEVLFIPAGWLHDVTCLTDSISVTWNFVHASGVDRLCAHLREHPDDPEMDVVRFFLRDWISDQASVSDIVAVLENNSRRHSAAA